MRSSKRARWSRRSSNAKPVPVLKPASVTQKCMTVEEKSVEQAGQAAAPLLPLKSARRKLITKRALLDRAAQPAPPAPPPKSTRRRADPEKQPLEQSAQVMLSPRLDAEKCFLDQAPQVSPRLLPPMHRGFAQLWSLWTSRVQREEQEPEDRCPTLQPMMKGGRMKADIIIRASSFVRRCSFGKRVSPSAADDHSALGVLDANSIATVQVRGNDLPGRTKELASSFLRRCSFGKRSAPSGAVNHSSLTPLDAVNSTTHVASLSRGEDVPNRTEEHLPAPADGTISISTSTIDVQRQESTFPPVSLLRNESRISPPPHPFPNASTDAQEAVGHTTQEIAGDPTIAATACQKASNFYHAHADSFRAAENDALPQTNNPPSGTNVHRSGQTTSASNNNVPDSERNASASARRSGRKWSVSKSKAPDRASVRRSGRTWSTSKGRAPGVTTVRCSGRNRSLSKNKPAEGASVPCSERNWSAKPSDGASVRRSGRNWSMSKSKPHDGTAVRRSGRNWSMSKSKFAGSKASNKDLVAMWDAQAQAAAESSESDPFSKHFNGGKRLKKGDPGYGRPPPGSKTEARGQAAGQWVEDEVIKLLELIEAKGKIGPSGKAEIRFGDLFALYENISDSLVGIVMRARKWSKLTYQGDMLFQGQHDAVVITLL